MTTCTLCGREKLMGPNAGYYATHGYGLCVPESNRPLNEVDVRKIVREEIESYFKDKQISNQSS